MKGKGLPAGKHMTRKCDSTCRFFDSAGCRLFQLDTLEPDCFYAVMANAVTELADHAVRYADDPSGIDSTETWGRVS